MSNTKYGRTHLMRFTGQELHDLAKAAMSEISHQSHLNAAAGGGSEEDRRYVRSLRTLLERIAAEK